MLGPAFEGAYEAKAVEGEGSVSLVVATVTKVCWGKSSTLIQGTL